MGRDSFVVTERTARRRTAEWVLMRQYHHTSSERSVRSSISAGRGSTSIHEANAQAVPISHDAQARALKLTYRLRRHPSYMPVGISEPLYKEPLHEALQDRGPRYRPEPLQR